MECVRSYAWSKGHSDPDLSSVLVIEYNMEITKALDFVIDQFLVGRSCFAKRNEPIHLESLKFAFGPKNLCQNQESIFLTQQCV